MSINTLKNRIPDYAKDIKLNLSNVTNSGSLSDLQLWGSLLAAAFTMKNRHLADEVLEDCKDHLSEKDIEAVKAAVSIMSMNNVYYRSLHLLSNTSYGQLPARLRMNVIGNPGVDKATFELWSLVVSAINGCGMCLDAHEREVVEKGLSREAVQDALRIAAVIHATAVVLEMEGIR